MAKFWRDFYVKAAANNLGGQMAPARLQLLEEILRLF